MILQLNRRLILIMKLDAMCAAGTGLSKQASACFVRIAIRAVDPVARSLAKTTSGPFQKMNRVSRKKLTAQLINLRRIVKPTPVVSI